MAVRFCVAALALTAFATPSLAEPLSELKPAHEGSRLKHVYAIAFSLDGRTLASAGEGGIIHLWDYVGGKVIGTLKGRVGNVECMTFSPDGRILATAGNRTVWLWEVASGRNAAILTGHTNGEADCPSLKLCRIEDSPHFRCLSGETHIYQEYLERFRGRSLCDDHSVDRLMGLASDLRYLEPPDHTCYILVRRHGRSQYVIQDGLHRASVLCWRRAPSVVVAITT